MGFVPLPVRCPECNRRQIQRAQMAYGFIDRCPHCNTILFVTLLTQLQLAFVARLTVQQWRDFDGLTPREVLRRLSTPTRAA